MRRIALISPILTILAAACAAPTPPPLVERPALDPHFLARERAMQAMRENFERVHFEFDSSRITTDTREALFANVDIMRRFPSITVEIEGHCDEVGSVEYNLALGQRRAEAIAKYMTAAGVERARVRTISYGKERPLEQDHAVNRRAEFRVASAGAWLTVARTR